MAKLKSVGEKEKEVSKKVVKKKEAKVEKVEKVEEEKVKEVKKVLYGKYKLEIWKEEKMYPERNEVKIYLSDGTTEIINTEELKRKKQQAE